MRITSNQDGFTLTELVVGMAIMSIIMAAIWGIFSISLRSQQYGFSQERVYNEGRRAINAITEELRYATVTTPTNSQISYTQGGENRTLSFDADAHSITLLTPTATTSYALGMVESVSFQIDPDALNLIHVNMKLSYQYQGFIKTLDFSISVMTGTKF